MRDDELSRDRWQELVDLREDMDRVDAVLPIRISDVDGSRLEASPRAVQFARALAFDAGWSGISDARRRHNDLAA
jgi:hypothetical protein